MTAAIANNVANMSDDSVNLPFINFYPGDYLKDTTALSCEENGAYILILLSLWCAKARMKVTNYQLARICRLSVKRWNKIRDNIMCYFIEEDGYITNKRLEKEYRKALEKARKRAAAGAKGGRKTAENNAAARQGYLAFDAASEGDVAECAPADIASLDEQEQSNDRQHQQAARRQSFSTRAARRIERDALPILMGTADAPILSRPIAEELCRYRADMKCSLNEFHAKRLAVEFINSPDICEMDPDAAAQFMMARGWKNYEAEWVNNWRNEHGFMRPNGRGRSALAMLEEEFEERRRQREEFARLEAESLEHNRRKAEAERASGGISAVA